MKFFDAFVNSTIEAQISTKGFYEPLSGSTLFTLPSKSEIENNFNIMINDWSGFCMSKKSGFLLDEDDDIDFDDEEFDEEDEDLDEDELDEDFDDDFDDEDFDEDFDEDEFDEEQIDEEFEEIDEDFLDDSDDDLDEEDELEEEIF
jgi:hypothetical protein